MLSGMYPMISKGRIKNKGHEGLYLNSIAKRPRKGGSAQKQALCGNLIDRFHFRVAIAECSHDAFGLLCTLGRVKRADHNAV